jgi:hypothetical protein
VQGCYALSIFVFASFNTVHKYKYILISKESTKYDNNV